MTHAKGNYQWGRRPADQGSEKGDNPVTAIDLNNLTLAKGLHMTREQGVCLMEAVAWWAGKDHTDHPPCVANVLGDYGRSLNDLLPDDRRQLLKPYIPLLPGTAGDGRDETRSYIALDWLVRTWTPAFLELAGIDAADLRAHGKVDSLDAAGSIGRLVRAARDKAAAARVAAGVAAGAAADEAADEAAGAAAWNAAGAAGGAAAWAAGGAAARDAAVYAGGAAARDAAGAAGGAAAWNAAGDAAGAAGGDAAWNAATAAGGAAVWAAARDAAGDVLASTVAVLQDS